MPDDDGESFVDGHDLGEQTSDLRVADDQVVRPLERRPHATESHERGARRQRHAGDHQLRTGPAPTSGRKRIEHSNDGAGGRLPLSIQSPASGALEVGDGDQSLRRALDGPSRPARYWSSRSRRSVRRARRLNSQGNSRVSRASGRKLQVRNGGSRVTESPDRQSRRDRGARHAHLSRDGHRHRRRLLRTRPQRVARAISRRGLRARRPERRRELPQHRGDP